MVVIRKFNPLLYCTTNYLFKCNKTNYWSSKSMSSTTLSVNILSGIAVLDMHFKPANLFTWDLMTDLRQQFENIETNTQIRALIITSSLKCFIAGDDINEFYYKKRVYDYIEKSRNTFESLNKLPIPTIAAINGHTYGSGCFLANACDYSYIVKSAEYGLNGLTLNFIVNYMNTKILGHNRGCIEGKVMSASEAFNIGWIDGIADDVNQLMSIANTKAELLIKIPNYASIKKISNFDFKKYSDKQILKLVENACSDSTNTTLGDLVKSMSREKSI